MRNPSVVAHCDWSKDPKKRWIALAIRQDERWEIFAPVLVGSTSDLLTRIRQYGTKSGPIAVGFDFPIGLPSRYGELTGLSDFKSALSRFGNDGWDRWFDVCRTAEEISKFRPFYPYRPGNTSRDHLSSGIGVPFTELLRQCELPTNGGSAACCLFWTLGGNQVGKAAITGWQEVIKPNIDQASLWPFDGNFGDLVEQSDTILLETYPGDVYRQLGLAPKSEWSKTKQQGRQHVAPTLLEWFESRPVSVSDAFLEYVLCGFSPESLGEDEFDALVGLLGMLDVIEGRLVEGCPQTEKVIRWEGWIFGKT